MLARFIKYFSTVFLLASFLLFFDNSPVHHANASQGVDASSTDMSTQNQSLIDYVDSYEILELALNREYPEFENINLVNPKAKPVITVGYVEGMALISDPNSYNNKGYGYDLLEKFGQYAGIDFKYVDIGNTPLEALNRGLVDISGINSTTLSREDEYAFGKLPVGTIQYALATKGENNYFYDDPQTINGKVVATFKGNPGNDFLDEYLEKHNISVKYVYGELKDYTDLTADFYITLSIRHTEEQFTSVLNLKLRHLYFIAKKGNEKLMEYFDTKLYQFFVENASFPDALADKYRKYGNSFRNRSLTREEASLLEGKTFRVGYHENHAPYQKTNAYGDPTGINVEFMNKLAAKYKFNVEYVPFNLDKDWTLFEDLDIIISLIGDRNHITRFYVPTDSYAKNNMNIVFKQNYAADTKYEDSQFGLPKGSIVGIINYISFRYGDFFAKYPDVKIIHYTDVDPFLAAFETGAMDALIATDIGTNSIASSSINAKYQNSLGLPIDMNFQISRKISDPYLNIFNVIINKEPTSTIENIIALESSKYLPEFGTEQFIKQNMKLILLSVAFAIAVIIGLVMIIRQRSAISVLAQDDITDLLSMSQFTKEVDTKLANANLKEYEMILLDIDYFRMINNYYGTDKGTEVIQAMASALQDAYKNIDVLMARRVAEQFLVFKKVEKGLSIQEVIETYVIPRVKAIVGESYSLKMSIASCINADINERMTSLLDNVNVAHHSAKKVHKVSYAEFTDEMRKDANSMLDIIYRMEHAIQNKEFKVHYQPKISFNTMQVSGAEALIRWLPPIGDPIYPNAFIPVMEKNGFISQLEIYIFEEVCSFLQANNRKVKLPKVAINISPITLSNATYLKKFSELLKQYQISASQIEIEITESALGDFEETLPIIVKILHKMGFSVAMDDFGAGNSSLNRLGIIEVDVLKLDKAFLDFHEESPRGSLLVQQVITLAKQLGMKVVAEGIETKGQAKWLKELECDIAQGYYFEKVLKADDFIKLLLENKNYSA